VQFFSLKLHLQDKLNIIFIIVKFSHVVDVIIIVQSLSNIINILKNQSLFMRCSETQLRKIHVTHEGIDRRSTVGQYNRVLFKYNVTHYPFLLNVQNKLIDV